MQLEKIQYAPPKIPELVMKALIDAIDSGHIQVGEELPSERDLAETLGVGRGSLRECLAILEFLGAIENRSNRKVVMRDADYIQKAISFVRVSNQSDTQRDFNEFRRINEVAIVELACQRATADDLSAIYEAIQHLEASPDDYMTDVEFHDALAVASHNVMGSPAEPGPPGRSPAGTPAGRDWPRRSPRGSKPENRSRQEGTRSELRLRTVPPRVAGG